MGDFARALEEELREIHEPCGLTFYFCTCNDYERNA